jgi:dienelactone hydrolase
MSSFTLLDERDLGDLVEVRFSVDAAGEAAPGVLFYPEGEENLPLVLIQHPATSSKDDYFVRDVGLMWARHGWACAGLDAPFHGERATYDPMGVLRDRSRFQAIAVQFAAEAACTIDELRARYPIDPRRLGYVGYSMGSMLGLEVVGRHGGFTAAAFCLIGEGGMVGSAAAPGSPVQALGGTAVRIVAKLSDEFFSREATERLFDALPSADKDLIWLPGGHFEIGTDVIRAAEQWLERKL